MRRISTVLALLLLAGSIVANAGPLAKGEKEINFKLDWTRFDTGVAGEDKVQRTSLEGTFGYLFTSAQEVGGLLSYQRLSDGSSATDKGVGVFYHYNFDAGDLVVPYVGARVVMLSMESSAYGSAYGVLAGLKVFPWANGGFSAELAWDDYRKDEAPENGKQLGLFAGVLLKW